MQEIFVFINKLLYKIAVNHTREKFFCSVVTTKSNGYEIGGISLLVSIEPRIQTDQPFFFQPLYLTLNVIASCLACAEVRF